MTVTETFNQTLKDSFNKTVIDQIAGDRSHGWGLRDSLAVAKTVFEWAETNSEGWSEDVAACIAEIINPSAFRQRLEGIEGKGLLDASSSPRAKRNSMLADYQ